MLEKVCGRSVVRDRRCIFHLEYKTKEEAKKFRKNSGKKLKRWEKIQK